jgi:hypothetical protein
VRRFIPILGLALAAATSTANGQEAASAHIESFGGFGWGTPRAELEARLGEPLRADTLETGFTVLAWADRHADTTVVALYGLSPEDGLVKGQYTLRFGPEDDCIALFRRFRSAFLLRYPLLVPEDRSFNESAGAFCPAVADGKAGWLTRWDDDETGARASVLIESGQTRVNAVVESAAFLEWLERTDG